MTTEGVVVPISDGIPGAPSFVVGQEALLRGIACINAATCVAVGSSELTDEGVVVPIHDGVPGTVEMVPNTASLYGVSCMEAGTSCVAVGTSSVLNQEAPEAAIVRITNPNTGAVHPPTLDGFNNTLVGVSCPPGNTSCIAITGQSSAGIPGGWLQTDGNLFSPTVAQGKSTLKGISCADQNACTTVGSSNPAKGYVFAGMPNFNSPKAPPASTVSGADQLFGVSCFAGVTGCEEVGSRFIGPSLRSTVGVVQRSRDRCLAVGVDSSGTTAVVVELATGLPTGAGAVAGTGKLYGVACPITT